MQRIQWILDIRNTEIFLAIKTIEGRRVYMYMYVCCEISFHIFEKILLTTHTTHTSRFDTGRELKITYHFNHAHIPSSPFLLSHSLFRFSLCLSSFLRNSQLATAPLAYPPKCDQWSIAAMRNGRHSEIASTSTIMVRNVEPSAARASCQEWGRKATVNLSLLRSLELAFSNRYICIC